VTLKEDAKPGHYEIHSPIGAGGMGEVFLARDERLGRNVAIFREYDVSPDGQRFLA
jgi:eukaryotic-like serine/threonine-protein kinase